MTDYNATITYATREDIDDDLVDALIDYHPATDRADRGWIQAIITLPATNLKQATTTALTIAAAAHPTPILGIEVITTEEFDKLNGSRPMPELVSVSQAAEIAGVSRQAILQRLESGSLQGQRVGNTWVVRRDCLTGPSTSATH